MDSKDSPHHDSPLPEGMKVDLERIKRHVLALADIGKNTQDHGVYRMAFSDADMEAKRWLLEQIDAAGLESRSDGAANIFGVLKSGNDLPSLLVGSHIDTVPCAGTLDGSLGVVVGLECLRVMHDTGLAIERDVELVAFSDEEGRFGGMLGSESFCGLTTPQTVQSAVDSNGVSLKDAMLRQGLDPMKILEAHRDPKTVSRYIELHIEQGPVLDRKQLQIGIVDEITGLFRWNMRIQGESNHAGTTPMDMRRDAFMGLADFAHEIPRVLEEIGSERSRATIGTAEILPGAANTVPGTVEFTLDVRDTSEEILSALKDALRRALSVICRRRSLTFDFEEPSFIHPVKCDGDIVGLIEQHSRSLDYSYLIMPSGAAHDAQIMGRLWPVGMIFVPSRGGVSHSPAEWSPWTDIEAGANVLLKTLVSLAQSA
jgi:N-carbamoyl-L-amino-acid hydrolase